MTAHFDRRGFLQTTGYLLLSFALSKTLSGAALAQIGQLVGDLEDHPLLSSWLKIQSDDTVTLMIGKVELGQGAVTAIAQVCAEELDIDLKQLKIISGDTVIVPDEGVTAGSQSMPYCASAVQQAAAEVRQILLELASAKFGIPATSLVVSNGTVEAPNGSKLTYGELIRGKELERKATGQAKLKPYSEYRYIGRSVPRLDMEAIMTGRALYVQEHRPAGMLHGAVVRPPNYTATLKDADVTSIGKMPGVLKIVRSGSFLGIIAKRQDQAYDAASALAKKAEWNVKESLPGNDGIYDWLLAAKTQDKEILNIKRAVGTKPTRTIRAQYERPYQMHASIGPSAAIATYGQDGVLTIQTHSQ